jgi:hypothetical protein
LSSDPAGQASKEALKNLYEIQHKRIEHLWREFHLGYMAALRQFSMKKGQKFNPDELKIGDLVLYEAPKHVRNFWPIAKISGLITNRKGNVVSVRLKKYVPNEINQPLRLSKYGSKRMTTEMKRELLGYFKEQPNTYPIQKIAPYEFWNDITDPTKKKDNPEEPADRLPARITKTVRLKYMPRKRDSTDPYVPSTAATNASYKRRAEFARARKRKALQAEQENKTTPTLVHFSDEPSEPIIFTYHEQSEDCSQSRFPLECKGGVVRLTLESKRAEDPIKRYKLPISILDEHSNEISKERTAFFALVAFCRKSPYKMTQVQFETNKPNGKD